MIDYRGMSIKAQAQCETAVHSLYKIDKALEKIYQNANKLESEKVNAYESYLLESKKKIKNQIEKVKEALEGYNQNRISGTQVVSLDRETQALIRTANELTGSKLSVLDEMINNELFSRGEKAAESLFNQIHKIVDVNQNVLDKINSIEDVSLRELAYQELLKNKNGLFDSIIKKAQKQYDLLLGRKTEQIVSEYKEELKASGIDTEVLNNAKTADEVVKVANDAIVDEKVRKETLKVIIKAIKSRGFIVDTKSNLKIDRARNVVKLVALKASGQKAEFEIQLNGKFMYHFDNYEGQACKKDIEPFMKDLHDIYDINVLHEEVIWSNPDKIQMKQYRHVKENKGNN